MYVAHALMAAITYQYPSRPQAGMGFISPEVKCGVDRHQRTISPQ